MTNSGIYCIEHAVSGKAYIGSAVKKARMTPAVRKRISDAAILRHARKKMELSV